MSAGDIRAGLQMLCEQYPYLSQIHVHETLPSTNSWLIERPALSAGTAEVAIALHQTAGRGRRGKQWSAPSGSGLCLSISWQYETMPENPGAISLAAGVAVARVLESIGCGEIMLKWPNDVVWQSRKLGGILVESVASQAGFRVVAGVGINLELPDQFRLDNERSWSEGPVDLKTIGVDTTIAALSGRVIPAWLDMFASYGSNMIESTIEAFNRRHWLKDRAAERDGQMLRCGAIDASGRLQVVDMQTGQHAFIDSGEVTPLAWSRVS